MKKIAILSFIFCFLILSAAFAQDDTPGTAKIATLAVMPFDNSTALSGYEGVENGLSDLMINAFYDTGKFLVVERGRLDAVLNEMKLNMTGVVSSDKALDIGKQLGADYVFAGTIASVTPIKERKSMGFAWIESKGYDVVVQGRIIEVARGVVVASAAITGTEKQTKKSMIGATTGAIAPDEVLIKLAVQKTMEKTAATLASQM
jgi:curli biogenesis system outer membrane secretion channel CsgG